MVRAGSVARCVARTGKPASAHDRDAAAKHGAMMPMWRNGSEEQQFRATHLLPLGKEAPVRRPETFRGFAKMPGERDDLFDIYASCVQ